MNNAKIKFNFDEVLLFILLFSFCLPNFNILSIGETGLKLYRVVVLFATIYIFVKGRIKIPSSKLLIFFVYMISISFICIFIFGYERLLFDYIFAFLIMMCSFNISSTVKSEKMLSIINKVSIIILGIILLNVLKNIDQILLFLKNPYNNHPIYESIFTGGANLECTWPGMLAVFFIKKPKRGIIYLSLCFIVSILLSSRVGILVDIMALYFLLKNLYPDVKSLTKKRLMRGFILFSILFFILSYILLQTNYLDTILDRFINLGSDTGSQGRLRMWMYVFQAFLNNPFGYGAGNAILAVKNVSHLWYGEDNVHNLIFQMLLDFGLVGMLFYLKTIYNFIKNEFRNLVKNPFAFFILIYIIIGLIQFKGAELITFFVIGLYLNYKKNKVGETNEQK